MNRRWITREDRIIFLITQLTTEQGLRFMVRCMRTFKATNAMLIDDLWNVYVT
jgi:hypothetical protein